MLIINNFYVTTSYYKHQGIWKKVQKFWKIKIQVNRNNVVSRTFSHEPDEEDIQNFADSVDNFYGDILVDVFWRIS